jgi:hypothetical protein
MLIVSIIVLISCKEQITKTYEGPQYGDPPIWADSTIYNNVGVWHNNGLDPIVEYINTFSIDSLIILTRSDNWVYTNTFVAAYNNIKAISEFEYVEIDTTGLRDTYNSIKPLCFDTTSTISDFIDYLDSVVTANNGSSFYVISCDTVTEIMYNINYENDLNNYLWSVQVNPNFTQDEKDYVRIIVSVAKSSRYYWDNNPLTAHKNKYDYSIQAWGLGAVLGAIDVVGAGVTVYNDLTDGQPNNGWKIAGRAAVNGLGYSALGFLAGKVKA